MLDRFLWRLDHVRVRQGARLRGVETQAQDTLHYRRIQSGRTSIPFCLIRPTADLELPPAMVHTDRPDMALLQSHTSTFDK
jgi:hypothetical protein